jgi:FAD/FMN-containing dehydrogenase
MAKDAFLSMWDEIVHAVHEVVLDLAGSISAEHGIGVMKRAELAHVKGAVAMDLMRRIKSALDPKGILNPGKVL